MRISSRRLSLVILAIFILASLVTVLRHEMWRDEFQSWFVAKDSSSLTALVQAVRYEKHPLAWYVVLFFLTRLTQSPISLQLLHLGLASLSAWLVLRYSPFLLHQKILLVFGYYLFYEYSVVSRTYALGILSLFLFCVFMTRRPDRPLLWGASLFVLANTSLYGLILAAAAGAAAALETMMTRALRRNWASYAALLLVVLGGIFCILSLAPVPDCSWDYSARHLSFNPKLLSRVLHLLPRAFFPIPRFTLQFWNSSLLDRLAPLPLVNFGLAILIIVFAVVCLRRKIRTLVFFVFSTFGILGWSYFGSRGFIRHQGHLFIAFIAALWLAGSRVGPGEDPGGREKKRLGIGPRSLSTVLTAILAIQCVAGLYAAGMDILYPFSRAKETAAFIKKHGYRSLPIVGEMDYLMTPVCGYLGRKAYFVRGERIGSYVKWDMKRLRDVRPELILTRAEQFAWRKQRDCLILLNFTLDPRWERPGRLIKLLSTGPAIVGSETYRLYLLKYTPPPAFK